MANPSATSTSAASPAPARPGAAGGTAPAARAACPALRRLEALVGAGVVALALPLALFGSAPVKVVAVLVALCALQGLWRGAAEVAGVVVGMVLAMALAPSLGVLLEGLTGAVAGTTGLTNRAASVVAVGLGLILAGWVAGALLGRRALRRWPRLRAWNHLGGGALGVAEGCLLALMLLWAPLAMEPIARMRLADDAQAGRGPDPASDRVVRYAQAVRDSGVGALAESTNPLPALDLLRLAADFAAVARDRAALDHFVASDPMRTLQALDSVKEAMRRMEAAPELRTILDDDGVQAADVLALLASPTILAIMDETTILADIRPLAEPLAAAIVEARAQIR